jgi:hypothetical protein
MKIYFAGSIRGGRDDKPIYLQMIEHLRKYGQVLTEHIGDQNLTDFGDDGPSDEWIYGRDMSWLREADIVVAEVSTPSLGVGYEIAKAEELNKKILCLYRDQKGKRLSAMVSGNRGLKLAKYRKIEEAIESIDGFLKGFLKQK